MGAWPTKADPLPETPDPSSAPTKMASTMSPERNNNVHIASFDVVESTAAASLSPMAKIWILLTPKVLKVIIVVLVSAVIAGTTVIIIIIVTHITIIVSKPHVNITTLPPPAPTPTTMTTLMSTSDVTSAANTTSSTEASTTSSASSSTSSTWTTSLALNTTTSATPTTPTTTITTATPLPVCARDEFLCGSGECIPWKYLCDGLPHCLDGGDEGIDCVCGSDQWRCTSGQCISSDAVCDQVYDCYDSSDEMLCPDCSGFQCDTGLCLWDGNERRCNEVFDCPDLSDEMGCPPRAGTVECANSVRVRQAQWCDGLDHCGDNSDETDCAAACPRMRVACPDGRCILRTWLCDGYADCQNGTDESNCGSCLPSQFMCDDYRCLDEASVCDGVKDCRMGEDELHCFSAQDGVSGVLWAHYQGKDYAVCADAWSTDFAIQICTDIDQLQLLGWEMVKPATSTTHFIAFNNTTNSAHTTNLVTRDGCSSGSVISISCSKEDCGERKVAFLQSFVAGGEIVSAGKWPWMVSLLHLGRSVCGGALINNSWVVTAAHCILNAVSGDYNLTATPYYFDAIVGSTHKLGQSRVGTPYRIRAAKVLLFPNLTRSASGGVDGDVALVKLSVPVDFTDFIQPLCLPPQGQSVARTSLCYVAGWGLLNHQQVLKPQQLRDTRMQVWSDSRCARNTIPGETTVNTNSTLCAGFLFGNPAACQGDSGGPLMCLSASGRWVLQGVMSRGSTPCGFYQPGIRANRFARISSVVDWVRQQMGAT